MAGEEQRVAAPIDADALQCPVEYHRQERLILSERARQPRWDRALYGRAGAAHHDRLEDAAKRDWEAAHKACSWGLFQILGENYKRAGHETIPSFVDAMHKGGAAAHLDAFVAFIKGDKRLVDALKKKDWATFARIYSGPGYAANQYDTKLAQAYRKWT